MYIVGGITKFICKNRWNFRYVSPVRKFLSAKNKIYFSNTDTNYWREVGELKMEELKIILE